MAAGSQKKKRMAAASASSSRPPPAAPMEVEDPRYLLPTFASNPGDEELLRHFRPLLERYSSSDPLSRTRVNTGLPWLDPWNLPGMPTDEVEGRPREKYFVTDYDVLKETSTVPATANGLWKPRDSSWGIRGHGIGPVRFAGVKTTYDFHTGQTLYEEGTKRTNWTMDVYMVVDQENGKVEDDLVMCHVFKSNSREYDPKPRCAGYQDQSPKEIESLTLYHYQQEQSPIQCDQPSAEELSIQAVHGQSNNSLFESSAGLLPTHISCNKPLTLPDHAPQSGCVSHHQASKENGLQTHLTPGSLAEHQEFQLPHHHNCHQNSGSFNEIGVSDAAEHYHEAIHGQRNNSFRLTENDFRPLSPHLTSPLSPNLMSFLANLGNIMENPDLEASMDIENCEPNKGVPSTFSAIADNGPVRKRPKTRAKSAVWNRYTKFLTKAKAVLAICNHCCKVMTGTSVNGTSHLKRHKCHCSCNHQIQSRQHGVGTVISPVAAPLHLP